jgi:4,5-dihydroxyphthalate decarboxylase
MGDDFWPYGLEANRATLETFVRYAHQQGIAARALPLDELFATATLDTYRT